MPDLVEAERWYIDVLGAELVARRGWGGETAHPVPQHVDIRIGGDVLSLFLGDSITGATGVPRHFHYAFTCGSLDELEQWQAHLRAKGVRLRNNGAVHGHPGSGAISLYFEDPWGAKLEITTWVQDYATATAEVAKRGGVIDGRPRCRRPPPRALVATVQATVRAEYGPIPGVALGEYRPSASPHHIAHPRMIAWGDNHATA